MITIKVDEKVFGTICICALRYAMGRQTYMPDLVRSFVRPLLSQFTEGTIRTMIHDCESQARNNCFGDELIDKPGWIKWEQELRAEIKRRTHDVEIVR